MDIAKNFAKVTVDGGYDDSVTEIDVIFSASNPFPVPPFNAVWWNATDYPDPADDPGVEIVRVTAQDDITLTITRAQEGTGAQDHNVVGKTYKLIAGLTAKVINDDMLPVTRNAEDYSVNTGVGNALIFNVALGMVVNALAMGVNLSGFFSVNANLATDKVQSGSTLGTVVGKLEVFDSNTEESIGFIPIYNSIT